MYGRRKITLSVTCVEPAQLVRDVGARFHKYYTYHLKANGCYKRMGVSDYRKFAGFAVLSRPRSASDRDLQHTVSLHLQRQLFRFLR